MVISMGNIKFIGYNNSKALNLYNHLVLFRVFLYLSPLYLSIVFAYVFTILELTILSLLPTMILLFSFIVFLFKKLDDKFLEETKQKHQFLISEGRVYRDNKEVKDYKSWKIYKYKSFLFIITKHTFYIIYNLDYSAGSRETFLEWARSHGIIIKIGY